MKTTKTTKKEDEKENDEEEERVSRIRFGLCWWIQKEHCEDRRDSLSFRNAEGKCQRDFQAEVNADECHRVHDSYELKWAGKRDANEYRKKVAKERRDNPDGLIAKDKEILAAAEKLAKKEQSHAEIEKRIKECEALSTRAMKKLS